MINIVPMMNKLDDLLNYAKIHWQVSSQIMDQERKQTELMQEILLQLKHIREENKNRS